MAARDDNYRNQRTLDVVFGVSCLALLGSTIWMLADDHYREFKTVQRKGRDVEVAVLKGQAEQAVQGKKEEIARAKEKVIQKLQEFGQPAPVDDENFVEQAKAYANNAQNERIRQLRGELNRLKPDLVRERDRLSAAKAERDALVSQRDRLYTDGAPAEAIQAKEEDIRRQDATLKDLEARIIGDQQRTPPEPGLEPQVAAKELEIAKERQPIFDAIAELDKLAREHDRLIRTARQKEIGIGAQVRALPVLDAFNSPYRIQQHAPDGLLIDYNFKQVQRNDRCATCHVYIDRGAGFDKETLRRLTPDGTAAAEDQAAEDRWLKEHEIAVYAAHPRLDLFLGSNSPHPIEKFGCTICHSGQGGSAEFNFAYHFPDLGKTDGKNLETYAEKRDRWTRDHHWHADLHPDYLWDFPMVPGRFLESTCLKCHYQVTDLIRSDGREEAPKLLKGWRLVRDLGCFGCHEISGYKGGRAIGPDLRLEPYPPLDELSPTERARLTADANDPPGTMRKVGPGLRRIAEKTKPQWTLNWIRSPRSFRPDTRMPHFFGLTNNTPGKLSDHQAGDSQLPEGMSGFPDAEIQAMTYYLFQESQSYLAKLQQAKSIPAAEWQKQQQLVQDIERGQSKLSKEEAAAALSQAGERARLRKAATALDKLPYPPPELAGHKPDAAAGRALFETRGCLACHTHDSIRIFSGSGEQLVKADYGPNLSALKSKLGNERIAAEKWLYYWLTDPAAYHPRTQMPNPTLEPKQRADLVAWLLGEGSINPPDAWKEIKVGEGDLKNLARAYLEKSFTKDRVDKALDEGLFPEDVLRPDADEQILVAKSPIGSRFANNQERLRFYVGKKSIGRYGCYGCHDIPGFESAKPIGTPLNDWGKKDPERLAFDNIMTYLRQHHGVGGHDEGHGTEGGPNHGHAAGYEPFFLDALAAAKREGFLHQKLREPRSFDYGKIQDRPWDDRLKMPQFKFAHPKPRNGEASDDFAKRASQEELAAIEAVQTFILGLVAEPIPLKFVNQPRGDRMHEVRGTQLLEKYNCIGCHTAKPGGYEFVFDDKMKQQIQRYYRTKQEELDRDPGFPESTAWRFTGPYPKDRGVARGLPFFDSVQTDDEGVTTVTVELWEALRFPAADGTTQQFPAGLNQLQVPITESTRHHDPYGGLFADILARILQKRENKSLIGDRGFLMGSVPPPLIREGQKVQPQWLLAFLQHPHEIRPAAAKNLRMPKFNLGQDAEALVNYFIAVDRIQEPGLGIEYLSPTPEIRDPAEQERIRAEYRALLASLAISPQERAHVEQHADYFEVGWRILTDANLCLKCHDQGGRFKAEGKPEEKGPALDLAAERLRPGYLQRYVSMPKRFLPYTLMPQYDPFYAQRDYAQKQAALESPVVKGLIQITPTLSPGFAAGTGLPLADSVYNNLVFDFALTPQQKVGAVRDALLSRGFLSHPPRLAQDAGPRGNPHGHSPNGGK